MTGIGGGKPEIDQNQDVNELVQQVLRESYQQTTQDLHDFAEKVRFFNQRKQALRHYLNELRKFKREATASAQKRGVDLCRRNTKDQRKLVELIAELAYDTDRDEIERELCIPERVPPESVINLGLLDNEIAIWEEKLATISDDAQLAAIDLQNMLQKQQQALQMLSNISKSTHDTMMSIIRKIGG